MNIAVFASGRGSNFQAILNAIQGGRLPASISLVVSNNSSAGALEIARAHGIPAVHRSLRQFPQAEAFDDDLLALLDRHRVDLIALAGYMKQLSPRFVATYRNRIVNVHPALLPAFGGPGMYGMHVHEAVLRSGAKVSGVTVHLVDEQYDHGMILAQETVRVDAEDTPESLAAKVLILEHEVYPRVLAAFAENRVRFIGQSAWIVSEPTRP
jgi:formyltetrahydrofolate-dependent phosphoribosylglycinamide formyltransferase